MTADDELESKKWLIFSTTRTYGIIHLYLHSNIDRHHQVLLLFSRPSTLLASKIIAAFKISVLHKWPPEGFLPKEFSFHAQLSSYAAGKNGTLTQLQRGRFSPHCEGIRFDSPTLFLFSSYFCGHCRWLCGDYISGIGENEGTPLCVWWHCDRPSDSFLSLIIQCPPERLSVSPLNGIDLSLSCSLGPVRTASCRRVRVFYL